VTITALLTIEFRPARRRPWFRRRDSDALAELIACFDDLQEQELAGQRDQLQAFAISLRLMTSTL